MNFHANLCNSQHLNIFLKHTPIKRVFKKSLKKISNGELYKLLNSCNLPLFQAARLAVSFGSVFKTCCRLFNTEVN